MIDLSPAGQYATPLHAMQEAEEVPVGAPILSAMDRRRSLSGREAALLLGVSLRALRRYAEQGLIPGAYRPGPGAHWRYKRRQLAEWWEALERSEWSRGPHATPKRLRRQKGGGQ
jgi:excisionase family DNA binding protein